MSRDSFPRLEREYNEREERLAEIRAHPPVVPVSTMEKPLTAIDYCAALEQCISITDVQRFAEEVPVDVREDERFTRAVAKRLAVIKDKR